MLLVYKNKNSTSVQEMGCFLTAENKIASCYHLLLGKEDIESIQVKDNDGIFYTVTSIHNYDIAADVVIYNCEINLEPRTLKGINDLSEFERLGTEFSLLGKVENETETQILIRLHSIKKYFGITELHCKSEFENSVKGLSGSPLSAIGSSNPFRGAVFGMQSTQNTKNNVLTCVSIDASHIKEALDKPNLAIEINELRKQVGLFCPHTGVGNCNEITLTEDAYFYNSVGGTTNDNTLGYYENERTTDKTQRELFEVVKSSKHHNTFIYSTERFRNDSDSTFDDRSGLYFEFIHENDEKQTKSKCYFGYYGGNKTYNLIPYIEYICGSDDITIFKSNPTWFSVDDYKFTTFSNQEANLKFVVAFKRDDITIICQLGSFTKYGRKHVERIVVGKMNFKNGFNFNLQKAIGLNFDELYKTVHSEKSLSETVSTSPFNKNIILNLEGYPKAGYKFQGHGSMYLTKINRDFCGELSNDVEITAHLDCAKEIRPTLNGSKLIYRSNPDKSYTIAFHHLIHDTEKSVPKLDFEYEVVGDKITLTKYIGTETNVCVPEDIDGKAIVTIGVSAFMGNTNLIEVAIPKGIKNVDDSAFYGCAKLTKVALPDSVVSIGSFAFAECKNLTNITLSDNITFVGNAAFYNCKKLSEITIPKGVSRIGSWTFDNTMIKSIVIHGGIEFIGYSAFRNCTKLIEISISDGLTTIRDFAFENCKMLTTIAVPESATAICENAFNNCNEQLKVLYKGNEFIATKSDCDNFFSLPSEFFVATTESKVIEFKHDSDGEYVKIIKYIGSSKKVRIPAKINGMVVKNITDSAFENNGNIESVILPESIDSIGNKAFNNCQKLNSINIENAVYIGEFAFSNCKLTEVKISDNIKRIGQKAFQGCRGLGVIYHGKTERIPASYSNDPTDDLPMTFYISINGNEKVIEPTTQKGKPLLFTKKCSCGSGLKYKLCCGKNDVS